MGKVIKNSSGQVVLSGDKALEITAAIDSNIVAGNIKKDVEILGVTGTYEGSGGGGTTSVSFSTGAGSSGYYTTSNGVATGISIDPMTLQASFDCMSKSLIYFKSDQNISPTNLVGATIITSETHGSRNPVYVWILQAN